MTIVRDDELDGREVPDWMIDALVSSGEVTVTGIARTEGSQTLTLRAADGSTVDLSVSQAVFRQHARILAYDAP